MTGHGRCIQHGLAAGPDGSCVLCHRGPAPAEARPGASFLAIVAGLVVLITAVVGAVGWKLARDLSRAVEERSAARARADASAAAAATNEAGVRLFVTSWCPHCQRAKAWMAQERVDYVEIDVEKVPGAAAELRRLNPRGGIPTLAANGEVVVGFTAEGYRAALAKPARR
jgi:mycoredoxin